MTRKYKIEFNQKFKDDNLSVPDIFDKPEAAYKFIDDWNLYKYEPKIVGIDDTIEYEKVIKNFKGEPAKYPPLPSKEQIAEYEKRKFKESEKTQEYDLTDDGKGKKYDNGKSMVGTLCNVFPRALLGVGTCIEFGTRKYPKPDNWKLVDGAFKRYQDSLMRHYLKFLAGEIRDSETNLLHLAHMAWNTLAILELYLMEHSEEFDKEIFK